MHNVLLPFVFDEVEYLSSTELIQILKNKDNSYYIDDINFLSIPDSEYVLCGYLPGFDPAENFYYVIARQIINGENIEILSPKLMILTCTSFECLERLLSIICKYKPQISTISINLPCSVLRMTDSDDCTTVREKLDVLIKEYGDYFEELDCLYDMRYESAFIPSFHKTCNKYRIEETTDEFLEPLFSVYENDKLLFKYQPNTFFTLNSNIESLRQPSVERLGKNVISFSDSVMCESRNESYEDAIKFCLSAISALYLKRGYIVKNIALRNDFENEDVCKEIGMTRFRQFIYYRVCWN